MPPEPRFDAVVLAAQRPGVADPLAAAHGVTHKCVVPVAGAPLIAHVVSALLATDGLARLRIVVEPAMDRTLATLLPDDRRIAFVPAAANLADSVLAATRDLDGATIVTTADNVLLTPGAVGQVLRAIRGGADVAVAMATRASVLAAHPDGQRRFYRFRDDAYSNCNLYGFGGAHAFAAAESYRSGGQFAKKPLRLLGAVGVVNLVLMLLGRLSFDGAMRRLSRRLRLTVAGVVLPDGAHAIDVDNARTHGVAAALLAARRTATAPAGRIAQPA